MLRASRELGQPKKGPTPKHTTQTFVLAFTACGNLHRACVASSRPCLRRVSQEVLALDSGIFDTVTATVQSNDAERHAIHLGTGGEAPENEQIHPV
jgi:hypothetical protein